MRLENTYKLSYSPDIGQGYYPVEIFLISFGRKYKWQKKY